MALCAVWALPSDVDPTPLLHGKQASGSRCGRRVGLTGSLWRGARHFGAVYTDAARQVTLRQALFRPRRLVPAKLLAGGPVGASRFRPLARDIAVSTAPQSGRVPPPHLDGVFRAVGFARTFGDEHFWDRQDHGLLFLFELHGFAELARYVAGPRALTGDRFWGNVIADWLVHAATPSTPAWHPFPTSGRILAWCAALSSPGFPEPLRADMVSSLARQLRLLRRSVEHDVGGNHVLRNACALVVGGLCCGDSVAYRRGVAVMTRELPKQVLPDGCHEERSPSYSRCLLDDLADVATVQRRAGMSVTREVLDATERLARGLQALVGPDGSLPLINDSWTGPSLDCFSESQIETDLSDGGFLVLRSGQDQAIFHIGPLCPQHLPAHAHAGALSFVLWIDGEQVVVDPGCGGYAPKDRDWARATRTHSTVEVSGQDQCVFWGPFRASRLPRVERGPIDRTSESTVVSAWHDGYRRLPESVIHVRTFCWLPGDGLVIVDRLVGGNARGTSRIVLASQRQPPIEIRTLAGPPPLPITGSIAPVFGVRVTTHVLEQAVTAAPSGWVLTRSRAEVVITGLDVEVRRPSETTVRFRLGGPR